jgi:hypothetical protein
MQPEFKTKNPDHLSSEIADLSRNTEARGRLEAQMGDLQAQIAKAKANGKAAAEAKPKNGFIEQQLGESVDKYNQLVGEYRKLYKAWVEGQKAIATQACDIEAMRMQLNKKFDQAAKIEDLMRKNENLANELASLRLDMSQKEENNSGLINELYRWKSIKKKFYHYFFSSGQGAGQAQFTLNKTVETLTELHRSLESYIENLNERQVPPVAIQAGRLLYEQLRVESMTLKKILILFEEMSRVHTSLRPIIEKEIGGESP